MLERMNSYFSSLVAANEVTGEIGNSKLVTGTIKMIHDATNALLIVIPIVVVLLVVYFSLRKGPSPEEEHVRWDKRIKTAIGCGIIAICADVIVKAILNYYQ